MENVQVKYHKLFLQSDMLYCETVLISHTDYSYSWFESHCCIMPNQSCAFLVHGIYNWPRNLKIFILSVWAGLESNVSGISFQCIYRTWLGVQLVIRSGVVEGSFIIGLRRKVRKWKHNVSWSWYSLELNFKGEKKYNPQVKRIKKIWVRVKLGLVHVARYSIQRGRWKQVSLQTLGKVTSIRCRISQSQWNIGRQCPKWKSDTSPEVNLI